MDTVSHPKCAYDLLGDFEDLCQLIGSKDLDGGHARYETQSMALILNQIDAPHWALFNASATLDTLIGPNHIRHDSIHTVDF
jgi:hypothetical protein